MSAEPAPFPGSLPARTMFAALFGEFTPHQRHDPAAELSEDAYSLFHARSSAMGWLTPAEENASGGMWGMNDAEASPASGPSPARVAWFQVVLTKPAPDGVLPVQPFLSCAGDVIARLGTLRLEAVQILLPGPDPGVGAPPGLWESSAVTGSLAAATNWFADCEPRLRAPVRVTLDGGADPAIRAAAPAIAEEARAVDQDVFACNSYSLADDGHLVLSPPATDQRGVGYTGGEPDAHNRVTFGGILTEWSLDALGWMAAFLADASSRHGVRSSLVITAAGREDSA